METKDWRDFSRGLSAELRNLRGGAPEVMKAFSALATASEITDNNSSKRLVISLLPLWCELG